MDDQHDGDSILHQDAVEEVIRDVLSESGVSGVVVVVAEVAFDDLTFNQFDPPASVVEGDIVRLIAFTDVAWDQVSVVRVGESSVIDNAILVVGMENVGNTDGFLRKKKFDDIVRVENPVTLGYQLSADDPDFPSTTGHGHICLVIHRPT